MIRLRYLTLSVLAVLIVVSTVPLVSSDVLRGEFAVPNWVKNTAGWWASDQIPDSAFLQGIQFLIKEEIIIVKISAVDSEVVEEVPGWVKNTAGWWAEDKIHDVTFVAAIKYLISQGIITVEQEVPEVEEPVEEVVEIKDFYMEINGGNCCLNWAYVNEEYRFEIETLDKKRGNYIDGVEINVKIISKGGELRHDFGQVTTEDGVYRSSITIPSLDWYAGNILFVTGEYYGVEKTIEKEFEVFYKKSTNSSSCHTVNPLSVASQDNTPRGIAFSSDGRKMFIVGSAGDDVNEYALSISYCLSTASYVDAFSVASQSENPIGIKFNTDGTKMFVVGDNAHTSHVNEYTLSTGFDVSTASHVDAHNVFSEEKDPRGVAFNSDGTKMFVVGKTNNGDNKAYVNEYTLSTGFDVSTASHVDGFLIASQENLPTGLAFSNDGTKMFVVGNTGDDVNEYTLSTGFDVSTASYVDAFSVTSQETVPIGIAFNSDGSKMFIAGENGDEVNEYTLTTTFDVSTASHK